MREICNSLIEQAYGYINGEQTFNLIENEESSIALDKLKTVMTTVAVQSGLS